MWFLGMSSSHDLCALHFVGFVSYQASDWWLRGPKASSYTDSGPFTQLDRCFWDGLKYPFSFLLLQFGTGIAVDPFQGQQEGGRCVGHKHSMKDLEPWAADVRSDLLRHLVHQCSLSCAPEVDHGVAAWGQQKNSENFAEIPSLKFPLILKPHLLLVFYWLNDGYHMFQLSCYHPTSATAGSCWIMGRQGGTEDKLGMTLDDVIRVQVRVPRSMP